MTYTSHIKIKITTIELPLTIGQQGPKRKGKKSESVVWQKPLKSSLVLKNIDAICWPAFKEVQWSRINKGRINRYVTERLAKNFQWQQLVFACVCVCVLCILEVQ